MKAEDNGEAEEEDEEEEEEDEAEEEDEEEEDEDEDEDNQEEEGDDQKEEEGRVVGGGRGGEGAGVRRAGGKGKEENEENEENWRGERGCCGVRQPQPACSHQYTVTYGIKESEGGWGVRRALLLLGSLTRSRQPQVPLHALPGQICFHMACRLEH